MEEKRFENEFKEIFQNYEEKPDEFQEAPQQITAYEKGSSEPEVIKAEVVDSIPIFKDEEPSEPEITEEPLYQQRAFAPAKDSFVPPFKETVKKEKKKMSVNAKIIIAAVLSAFGGCVITICLILGLLTVQSFFGADVAIDSGSKIYVSDAPVGEISDGAVSVADVIDAAGPAVVGINCETEYTDWFWGTSSVQPSSGSGVIINEDGYIVTNNHVIEKATSVSVTLISGESYEAKLIGRDARTDLAVIKIEAEENLPHATFGDSSKLRVGDSVIAIGNPLGEEFAGSATKGIISATNRTMTISDSVLTVIQTDAAINPGNSGGALINMNGEVIGINTAKIADSSVEGLGFSIPSNEFLPVIEELIENGHVTGRPLIGITGRDITKELSEQYGYPIGVYVVEVAPFSGAEDAGVKTKDVILAVDGTDVSSIEDINTIRDKYKAGDTIVVKVYRKTEDKTLELKLTLGEDKSGAQ